MGFRDAASSLLAGAVDRVVRFGQGVATRVLGTSVTSARQKALAELEALYEGTQYEHKGLAPPWTKQRPGGPKVPLRQQQPSCQYDLPRLIVDRPTALLFGEGRFPTIALEPKAGEDVDDVNAWLAAICEEGGLHHAALTWARQGGVRGSAVMTWSLVEGELEFEPHKSQHCTPTFHQRKRSRLVALEKRYKFKKAVQELAGGVLTIREVDFWHRETWDEQRHTVYVEVPVGDGKEPNWTVADEVVHGYGRCPAVWVKTLDDGEPSNIDGVSLLAGLEDVTEDVDRGLSHKSRALFYNLDPDRIYTGLPQDPETKKPMVVGGGGSTSLPAGADAKILELRGDALKIAEEHIGAQRNRALEVARVVVPEAERLVAAATSGTAIRLLFSPTLELVGELRQSFGEGLREIISQVLAAARAGKLQALGELETPPPDIIPEGKVKLTWGSFFDATPQDIEMIARAAVSLKAGGVLDLETLLHALAPFFGIRDVQQVLDRLEEEAAKQPDYGPMGNTPPKTLKTPPEPDGDEPDAAAAAAKE